MITPQPVIKIENVFKRFGSGEPALQGVSAAISPGRITGLVGPDGAGKTTLIRLITGLTTPSEGRIEVLGLDTTESPQRIQEQIGYMPQKFGLYEDLTVFENLKLYAELRGLDPQRRNKVFEQLLAFTGLGPFTSRLAGRLSGGMKQKLGLACALIETPRILLLDEPSVGVDPVSRRELWRMVENLKADGIAVIWSTAYLDEAERCENVLLLNEGRLLFHGSPSDLTEQVRGRVFHISNVQGRRRLVLAQALEEPGVIDGVIQGQAVRLVFAENAPLPDANGATGRAGPFSGAEVKPVAPRFEDAFVAVLGGSRSASSALAKQMPQVARLDEIAVEARRLTKKFGDFTAAEDMSFTISQGEIFGLLGPNGAGKSTTFKMLCGLLKPTSGEGRVAGWDLRRAAASARNQLGYMAQKFSLYGDLTTWQNLDFFSRVYGLDRNKRLHQTEMMIETFGLKHYLSAPARDLPLGYKQRLALSCAVMHEPRVLFLDEPTSGVDPLTRREFWTHINGLVEKGVAVLVTTHFMDEAEYCDRIALIYRGQTIATGSPDTLKSQIRSADLADPTLEDAFIELVQRFDNSHAHPR